jgi:5-methyltetrahydrofolate--homocysteine methyltransferase
MNRLVEALLSGRVLLMDGAMGTELLRLGLPDECSALFNLNHPEQVTSIHRAYLEAGAEILITNTFMANPGMLACCGLQGRARDIWSAAFACARIFRDPAPIILADIGPFSNTSTQDGDALLDNCCSADGILLETWSCDPERQLKPPLDLSAFNARLPVLLSFTYRRNADQALRSFWDAAPEDCALAATANAVCAIGANCGNEIDMDDLLEIVRRYRDVTDLPIFIRPNAGTPWRTDSGWEYWGLPEDMADKLWPLLEAGVTMVGGCCGTTPAHIAAFRRVVDAWNGRRAK